MPIQVMVLKQMLIKPKKPLKKPKKPLVKLKKLQIMVIKKVKLKPQQEGSRADGRKRRARKTDGPALKR